MDASLDDVLADVAAGRLPVPDAARLLRGYGYVTVGDYARLDVGRAARKGVPEVVYAEGKTADQVVGIVTALLDRGATVLCSRVDTGQAEAVAAAVSDAAVRHDPASGVLTVRRADAEQPEERGIVGILAAGTSDLGPAEEAAAVCRAMGVRVMSAYDVGVAGVHRLTEPLERLLDAPAACVVVAAGMEGALASVVAGLVPMPVIGLPTSTGYGMGGRGEAALLAMLQSCSPGLAVVNIDNGVGAGAVAALIARRTVA